jgi:hypothetical protein
MGKHVGYPECVEATTLSVFSLRQPRADLVIKEALSSVSNDAQLTNFKEISVWTPSPEKQTHIVSENICALTQPFS